MQGHFWLRDMLTGHRHTRACAMMTCMLQEVLVGTTLRVALVQRQLNRFATCDWYDLYHDNL